MIRQALVACALLLTLAGPASALGVEIREVHARASNVQTTIALRDVVPDRFKRVIDHGGRLHLRLQAELWESRPVWDRLVFPAIVRMVRFAHGPGGRNLTIDDSAGGSREVVALPNPFEVVLDLGARDRIAAADRYYVHVVATIGTLAEREVDDVGDAVFGREEDDNALGSFGRMLFRTALKVSDYLQSVSADVKSRKLAGTDIIRP